MSTSLRAVSVELRDKVEAFLLEEPKSQILRDIQVQLRTSMGVVDKALGQYSSVRPILDLSLGPIPESHADLLRVGLSNLRSLTMAEKTVRVLAAWLIPDGRVLTSTRSRAPHHDPRMHRSSIFEATALKPVEFLKRSGQ